MGGERGRRRVVGRRFRVRAITVCGNISVDEMTWVIPLWRRGRLRYATISYHIKPPAIKKGQPSVTELEKASFELETHQRHDDDDG